jgi:hypothetical protein
LCADLCAFRTVAVPQSATRWTIASVSVQIASVSVQIASVSVQIASVSVQIALGYTQPAGA